MWSKLQILISLFFISKIQGFMWNLFGVSCNCCRCGTISYNTPFHFRTPSEYVTPDTWSASQNMVAMPRGGMVDGAYRGPPSSYPTSREDLHLEDDFHGVHVAAPEHAIVRTTVPPVPVLDDDDHAIGELEKELAAEKYRYTEQLKKNRKIVARPKKPYKQRIRVFKLHHVRKGQVEGQNSQSQNGINDFSVEGFNQKQGLEEFIPIKIGIKPENADDEPAGPPPSVHNRVFSNPDIISSNAILRRRFVN